ncbi:MULTISPECIES: DUF1116 domain-containing protein [unclassified Vibrio]|uniref:DUF1116 domain-containing protein n=1 Tax=unclassified Vibrio TaxID=2614977 RepID=UPI00265A6EC9|nr:MULTISPECIES: DUF1116 domain-containing protein [unclassified Vibrio]ELB2779862.1 DUF1116 domain-containing protein [Vibrio parahaemolyticus]MCR9981300.1 DUF1116 domain-containing protein [Vibrio alginolyticus]MEA3484319.1 DUF1116 domain-containing protein [Pseudomonadota bacterium]MDU9595515.1 DUF1116 domain-containing protein [Vibrio sp. 2-1-2a]MDU9604688.1 DUF1116 domain-containing protein [Vibrio sp. 1-2-3a]
MKTLFNQKLTVLNAGLTSFATNIERAGSSAVSINWQPPANGDINGGQALAELINDSQIEQANQVALGRYLAAQPTLVDVMMAGEAIPELAERKLILHAGPPIAWDDMCGPVQGAILGAIVFEKWAKDIDEAQSMINSGEVVFEPCHHYDAVGPMAGIISRSMPVWVIENQAEEGTQRVFCNFNEGLGKVLRFGANSREVIERLEWMGTELAQAMQAAVREINGLELKPIMAQALHMGDEVHNRNAAATGLLLKHLLPALIAANLEQDVLKRVMSFVTGNDHFFLNLSMAACKSMMKAAEGVPNSTMVTVMARNGVNFGIQLSGTGNQWFQAPANPVNGLFFPGYGVEDAAADLGDSAITETAGVGGFAMASSPAIVKFVGGTPDDATNNSRSMQSITIGNNPAFTLPALNFAPTAAGIDARKVADSGVLPIINTGIAHKQAGVGQIGAGITSAPMQCFVDALLALKAQRASEE